MNQVQIPHHRYDKKDDQNLWFLLFTLLFIAITLFFGWVLFEKYGALPTRIPLFDATLIALASFRLTRLFVYDRIMQFIRNFFLVRNQKQDEKGNIFFELREPERGARKTLWHLANCPWCAGLWFSMLLVFFYFLTPLAWIAILIFAIAGVSTFFQILANLLGWSATEKKEKASAGSHETQTRQSQ